MERVAVVTLLAVAIGCASPPVTPTSPSATPPSIPVAPPVVTLPPSPAPSSTAEATEAPTPTATVAVPPTNQPAELELTSSAFAEGEPIPARYTCDGADDQLPVAWSEVPDGTAELALIQHDPDAGGFVHWVVVGIPPDAAALGENLPQGARHGTNDFGNARYDGPCPASGKHTYVTTLFALAAPLELGDAPTARQVRRAADGVTIATAQLRGTYRRD